MTDKTLSLAIEITRKSREKERQLRQEMRKKEMAEKPVKEQDRRREVDQGNLRELCTYLVCFKWEKGEGVGDRGKQRIGRKREEGWHI